MRRRALLITLGLAVLAAGAAAVLLLTRAPDAGHLETNLTDVTVVASPPAQPRPRPGPKPRPQPAQPPTPPEPQVDTVCWPMFGGSPSRELARPEIKLGAPRRRPIWVRGLGAFIEFPPVYCNGTLYVNTDDGDTFAIVAATGKVRWRRAGAAPKPSSPAIAGDLLIVTSKNGVVDAFDRGTGRTVWELRMASNVESSPLVAGGLAYFGANDGRLFAVDAQTGAVRWAYRTGGRINSSPTLTGDRVCVTTYAGSITCLRRTDGERLWSTFARRDTFRGESFYASASTDGERLYTVARSGKVLALSVASGRVEWTGRVGGLGYTTPAVGGDRIFAGGFDGAIRAFRAADGTELWRTFVGGRILGSPLLVGNLVLVSTLDRTTHAVRASDGKPVWRVRMGKYAPGIATEKAYYLSLNGMLLAYRGTLGPDG